LTERNLQRWQANRKNRLTCDDELLGHFCVDECGSKPKLHYSSILQCLEEWYVDPEAWIPDELGRAWQCEDDCDSDALAAVRLEISEPATSLTGATDKD
jgi:hypothetical protein